MRPTNWPSHRKLARKNGTARQSLLLALFIFTDGANYSLQEVDYPLSDGGFFKFTRHNGWTCKPKAESHSCTGGAKGIGATIVRVSAIEGASPAFFWIMRLPEAGQ